MNLQQRIDYIFNEVDGRTGKRFDWLYVLLDDIQTLIDGFKPIKKKELDLHLIVDLEEEMCLCLFLYVPG